MFAIGVYTARRRNLHIFAGTVSSMSTFGFGSHSDGHDNDRDNNNDGDEGRKNGNNRDGHHDNSDNDNGGFGFFFGPGSNPFGGGNLNGSVFSGGDLGGFLGQLGNMISGFSQDLNKQGNSPVNYALTERIARQHVAQETQPKSLDSTAVAESVRLVELWLDEATILPAGATGSVAFGPEQWLDETLPTWRRIITPLAEKLSDAALSSAPEELRGQLGPMEGIFKQINAMNFGTQLGATLGELAKGVVTSTQWGMPLAQGRTAAVATAHLDDIAAKLGIERREALIYLAAREAAHHRLFQHVPWLVERLILDVEEYAAGLALDDTAMQEAMNSFNPEALQDPMRMQEMMQNLQSQDLTPKVVSANAHARERLETILSLIEGWVDYVVGNALNDRIPGSAMINAGWSTFRNTGSPAMEGLTRSMGISLLAPKANEAAELFRRLEQAVGMEKRDAMWDHPDFLPVAEDLDNPATFIGRWAFDAEEMKDFDPIAEIEKLEQEKKNGDSTGEETSGDND